MDINNERSKMSTRRKEPRSRIPLKIKTQEGRGFNECVFNISPNGACFTSPVAFEKGELVFTDISLFFQDLFFTAPLSLVGRIMWIQNVPDEQPIYGVQFVSHKEKIPYINLFIEFFYKGFPVSRN
jgi:hypothetical protein